ncbi:hypothetical protein ABZP36_000497 [Zizania latifolia]
MVPEGRIPRCQNQENWAQVVFVGRHGLIMGSSVTGMKRASGDSPLQLGPKAEDVEKVDHLAFILHFVIVLCAGTCLHVDQESTNLNGLMPINVDKNDGSYVALGFWCMLGAEHYEHCSVCVVLHFY